LVFGAPPECPERRFCLAGLTAVYGLSFKEFRPLDAGGPLTVGALEGDEIDVGLLFTTSPAVATSDLVLLADDRGLQPAENVVPVVRTPVLERHGDALRRAADEVSRVLTTQELIGLNRRVDVEGAAPAEAAREWLVRHGLGRA
ncbi:MAG: glycine betaine ABC transporter substrate-binding protein, partial [Acidimicrobiales bacterium]